jgi:hypothetical protein
MPENGLKKERNKFELVGYKNLTPIEKIIVLA